MDPEPQFFRDLGLEIDGCFIEFEAALLAGDQEVVVVGFDVTLTHITVDLHIHPPRLASTANPEEIRMMTAKAHM